MGLGIPPVFGLGLGGICLGVVAAHTIGWVQTRSGGARPPFPIASAGAALLLGLLFALVPLALIGSRVAALTVSSLVQVLLAGLIVGVAIGAIVNWMRMRSQPPRVHGVASFPVLAPTVGIPAAALLLMLFSGLSVPHAQPGQVASPSPSSTARPAGRTTGGCASTPAPVASVSPGQLLARPWLLKMSDPQGARECYQNINPNVLQGRTTLRVTYNLHGMHAAGQDASALVIDQGSNDSCVNRPGCRWHYVSLSDYGENGYDGVQTANIPLSAFPGLDLSQPPNGVVHARFWASISFTIDIQSIVVS